MPDTPCTDQLASTAVGNYVLLLNAAAAPWGQSGSVEPPSIARLVWQKPIDGSETLAIAQIRWRRTAAAVIHSPIYWRLHVSHYVRLALFSFLILIGRFVTLDLIIPSAHTHAPPDDCGQFRRARAAEVPRVVAVVATLSKGYDLDYIWKQVDRGPAKDAASYYIQASESGGEPPGPLVGPRRQSARVRARPAGRARAVRPAVRRAQGPRWHPAGPAPGRRPQSR